MTEKPQREAAEFCGTVKYDGLAGKSAASAGLAWSLIGRIGAAKFGKIRSEIPLLLTC